jgi:hypothetical protein
MLKTLQICSSKATEQLTESWRKKFGINADAASGVAGSLIPKS